MTNTQLVAGALAFLLLAAPAVPLIYILYMSFYEAGSSRDGDDA